MRKLKRIAAAVAIVAGSYHSAASAQSLEQAVAFTLDSNPSLRVMFNRYKASQEQIAIAKGGYLPTLEVDAGVGPEHTNSPSLRADGEDDGVNYIRSEIGLTFRQMLFQGYAVQSDVARTTAESRAERYALLAEAENTALNVVEVYLDVLEAEQILELSQLNFDMHMDIHQQIRQRTESGVGTSTDLSQINARVALARTNMISAENNLRDSQSQFYSLVNQWPESLVAPVADADMVPTSKDEALEKGQQANPTLLSAQYDIQAAEAQYKNSKSGDYPSVSFEIDARRTNDGDGIEGYQNDLAAMIRVRWSLFDGGRDSAGVRDAAYQMAEAKDINDRAHRQLQEGVDLAWNAYDFLNTQLTYIRQHVEAAYSTKEAYRKQFDIGKRSLLDLLDTENELFEARSSYISVNTQYQLAKYRLLNASGQLLDSLRVTVPSQWQEEAE